jgi:Valyl-tRNA synthetase
VLDQTLRLLHPFVPFITEGIFQKLNEIAPVRKLAGLVETRQANALVAAEWPQKIDSLLNPDVEAQIENIQAVVRAVRDIRSKYGKPPGEKLAASANSPKEISDVLNANCDLICQLAGLKEFKTGQTIEKPENAAATIVGPMQIYLHQVIDVAAEQNRLEKQKQQMENSRKNIEAKLNNENFLARARSEVVAQTRQKLDEITEQLKTIEKHLAELDN